MTCPPVHREIYFLESLPYLKRYRAVMAHTEECGQCADVLSLDDGSGQHEDLCPTGQQLDDAVNAAVSRIQEVSAFN